MKDLATELGCIFWDAWFYMLGFGIFHSTYHQVPPIGYWFGVVIALFFYNNGPSAMIIRRLDS